MEEPTMLRRLLPVIRAVKYEELTAEEAWNIYLDEDVYYDFLEVHFDLMAAKRAIDLLRKHYDSLMVDHVGANGAIRLGDSIGRVTTRKSSPQFRKDTTVSFWRRVAGMPEGDELPEGLRTISELVNPSVIRHGRFRELFDWDTWRQFFDEPEDEPRMSWIPVVKAPKKFLYLEEGETLNEHNKRV